MKRYFVSFAAVMAGLLLCGPAWAVSSNYDFDGLNAGAVLDGQDNWVMTVSDTDVLTEASAKSSYSEAEQLNWTGFSGNVAGSTTHAGTHTRVNDGNWSFSIPSDATAARFSYTIFARGSKHNQVGLGWDADGDGVFDSDAGDVLLCRLGVNWNTDEWRVRASTGASTTSPGSGTATISGTRKSYVLTAVFDFTDPTKVLADMLVENLTDGGGVVEVMSDIDLLLSGSALDPSNWDTLYLRHGDFASVDNLTITVGGTGDPIPGDANLDNIVNDADASILAAHWQQTGMGWGDGDFNADNIVNDADASILAAHWQESQEGAAPVPEPSTLIGLLALGLAGLVALRRR